LVEVISFAVPQTNDCVYGRAGDAGIISASEQIVVFPLIAKLKIAMNDSINFFIKHKINHYK
jgi:hypothetical protein